MTELPDDEIVCVARGTLVEVELWEDILTEAGIESKVVGGELTASYGTAMPGSVELWVHRQDVPRAEEAIRYAEQHRGEVERPDVPRRPTESDPRPGPRDAGQGRSSTPRYQREPHERPGE